MSLVGAGRTGEGRIADVSLVEASIAAAAWEAAEYLETGQVPQPMGNKHRLTAPYQLFETSDRRYVAVGTPNNMLFEKFMQVIGLEQHLSDPRFKTYAERKANETPLLALVEPAIRAMHSDKLEAELMKVGVPSILSATAFFWKVATRRSTCSPPKASSTRPSMRVATSPCAASAANDPGASASANR